MSNRVRRTVFIRFVISKQVYGTLPLYQLNQNVFTSNHEEYFFHSAEIKELWLVPQNLNQQVTFSLELSAIPGTADALLPPIIVSPETSLIHVTPLFPFSASRRNLELGVGHMLRMEVEPRLVDEEQIIVNGFAEETGLAYDLTNT